MMGDSPKDVFTALINSVTQSDNTLNVKMLWRMIDPPEYLIGFQRVAENLTQILPMLSSVWRNSWSPIEMASLASFAKMISGNRDLFTANFIRYTAFKDGPRGPFQGVIQDHPLYCALWMRGSSEQIQQAISHLQAHYINGFSLIMGLPEKQRAKTHNVVKEMSIAVRNLPFRLDGNVILSRLPVRPLSSRQMARELTNLCEELPLSRGQGDLVLIERFLAFALDLRKPHDKKHHGIREQSYKRVREIEVCELKSKKISILQDLEPSADGSRARKEGYAESELYESIIRVRDRRALEQKKGESPLARAIKVLNNFRYIAAGNQHLPYSWNKLSEHDVAVFYKNCQLLLAQKIPEKRLSRKEQMPVGVLLMLLFWTSSPLSRVLSAQAYRTVGSFPKKLSPGVLYIAVDKQCWAVAGTKVEKMKQVSGFQQGYFRTPGDRMVCSFPNILRDSLKVFLSALFEGTQKKHFLFGRKKEKAAALQKRVEKILQWINRQNYTRLTLARLTGHLYGRMTELCQDMTDSSFCFCHLPVTGQSTPMYYYAVSQNYLRSCYAQICHVTAEEMLGRPLLPRLSGIMRDHNSEYYLGSNICPHQDVVCKLVADMLARLRYLRINYGCEDSFISYHNAYTAYCVMLLGFVSGYRSVRDPFSRVTDVDFSTGFVAISDKDDDDSYHSRLVWLPPLCIEQIKEYQAHRLRVASHIWPLNPKVASQLSNAEESLPFFFFLDNRANPEDVRSTTCQKHVGWCYDLPHNTNRHFLRTNLREFKVPEEIVNAHLGHWDRGQEPFGRYSTLSPFDYKQAIEAPLMELMMRSGWKVERSFL